MDEFLAALIPEPFKVAGKELRPLSYGHVLLLNRFGCEPVQDAQTLWLAVEICSRRYEEAKAFVSAFLGGAPQTIYPHSRPESFQAWADYLTANSLEPEYCPHDGPSSDKGAPALAQIRAWLIGHCGYSPEYLMDAPWGQCLWDFAVSHEEGAGYGIVGDHHREIAAILKEARN